MSKSQTRAKSAADRRLVGGNNDAYLGVRRAELAAAMRNAGRTEPLTRAEVVRWRSTGEYPAWVVPVIEQAESRALDSAAKTFASQVERHLIDASRNELAWQLFSRLLSERLDPRVADDSIEGWELLDAAGYGGGEYGVKVGVYPWGVTILSGRKVDILRDIKEIMQAARAEHRTHRGTAP